MNNRFPTTFSEYARVLMNRRRLFIGPFVAMIVVVALAYPFIPKHYRSASIILVNDDRLVEPFIATREQQSSRQAAVDNKIKMLTMQVQGRSNMRRIIQKLQLTDSSSGPEDVAKKARRMARRVGVNTLPGKMIEISYTDQDPSVAQKVATEVTQSLIDLDNKQRQGEATDAIKFIEGQLAIYKEKIQQSDKAAIAEQASASLDEAMRRRSIALDQVNQLERTLPSTDRSDNPGIFKLQADLTETRARLQRTLASAREDSPMVQELRKKIAGLESILAMERENRGVSAAASENGAYIAALRELKQANLDINALRRNPSSVSQIRPMSVFDPALQQDRARSVNEDIYQSLLKALETAQISQRMGTYNPQSSFRIVDHPMLPEDPFFPTPIQAAGAAFLLAVGAGLAAVLLKEFRDTSFRGVSDAKEFLSMPLLGTIPKIELANGHSNLPRLPHRSGDIAPQVVVFHKPQSLPSEYYRMLRTQLMFMTQNRTLQTLLVSSAVAGEGKTTTSINIATSMAAELNQRILLIDCDIRQGSIGRIMGLPQKRGLFDYLSGTCDLQSILKASRIDRLTVITAGEPVAFPAKLLSSERMVELMKELRSRFDFIIMDAPPVLPLADVPILDNYADGVVLVVEAGKTPRKFVQQAQQILEKTKRANMLGYVLTRAEEELPSEYVNEYFAGKS